MHLTPLTVPTEPCVSVPDARLHLRVDATVEDAAISRMIAAAAQDAEGICHRALMQRTFRLSLDAFDSHCIELRKPPVTSVEQIRFADPSTGVMTVLVGSAYQVDLSPEHYARVAPAYGTAWPNARAQLAAVQIDFTAGWNSPLQVPELVQQWVLLRVGAYYENREAWTQGKKIEFNADLDHMLEQWKVRAL